MKLTLSAGAAVVALVAVGWSSSLERFRCREAQGAHAVFLSRRPGLCAAVQCRQRPCRQIEDVQIDVKSGTARGDVNFFIQEIVNAPAEGYKVIAVNTGSTSKELVSALNEATKQGIKVMSFDGAPPPIDTSDRPGEL